MCLLHAYDVVAMSKGRHKISVLACEEPIIVMDIVDNAGPEKDLHEEP